MAASNSTNGHGNDFHEQFRDALDPILEARIGQRDRTLSEQEWDRLRTVAKEAESRGISFLEFAIELVRAFLMQRLPANSVEDKVLDRMSRTIGESLVGDHASRQKLAEFQQQLLGK